jgi:hypothetical protein
VGAPCNSKSELADDGQLTMTFPPEKEADKAGAPKDEPKAV